MKYSIIGLCSLLLVNGCMSAQDTYKARINRLHTKLDAALETFNKDKSAIPLRYIPLIGTMTELAFSADVYINYKDLFNAEADTAQDWASFVQKMASIKQKIVDSKKIASSIDMFEIIILCSLAFGPLFCRAFDLPQEVESQLQNTSWFIGSDLAARLLNYGLLHRLQQKIEAIEQAVPCFRLVDATGEADSVDEADDN